MPKYVLALIFGLCLLVGAVSGAQLKIVGGGDVTLEDLIREKTYVTFVLKSGARLTNTRITGVFETTIAFKELDKEPSAFTLSDIQEIRVQEARLPPRRVYALGSSLSEDELIVVERAAERALEIFKASKGNQGIRMEAALVLAASTHESKSEALRYLQGLAAGNDVPTAMAATMFLYLAGIPADPDIIQGGFQSGNRQTRASAARLAGLTNNETFLPEVRTMLRDSMVEIFPSAAKAIGRMGGRSDLPELYGALHALTEVKGEAAVFALSLMGGEEVHQEMLEMLDKSKGVEWFRVLRVLYALDDDRAKELMKTEALLQPAYQRVAALLLAADEVREGTLFLRDYLEKAEDPVLKNLNFKAKVAETLYMTGDIHAKNLLQELVNIRPNTIYARGRTADEKYKARIATEIQLHAVRLIGDTGARGLLSLLAGPLESVDPYVAITACTAATAIGNPEFGARFKDARR